MHELFNYTLHSYNSSFVRLHRQWINTTLGDPPGTFRGADLELSVPPNSTARFSVVPGNNGTWTPPIVDILVLPNSTSAVVRVAVVTNETSLVGLNTETLFLADETDSSSGLQTVLRGLADGTNESATQISFLTYADKFTAGGWRFLTVRTQHEKARVSNKDVHLQYFGRDSMIALRLLMPTLSSEAIEAALGAVIERANSTGALCHEETIGDYASFVSARPLQHVRRTHACFR